MKPSAQELNPDKKLLTDPAGEILVLCSSFGMAATVTFYTYGEESAGDHDSRELVIGVS